MIEKIMYSDNKEFFEKFLNTYITMDVYYPRTPIDQSAEQRVYDVYSKTVMEKVPPVLYNIGPQPPSFYEPDSPIDNYKMTTTNLSIEKIGSSELKINRFGLKLNSSNPIDLEFYYVCWNVDLIGNIINRRISPPLANNSSPSFTFTDVDYNYTVRATVWIRDTYLDYLQTRNPVRSIYNFKRAILDRIRFRNFVWGKEFGIVDEVIDISDDFKFKADLYFIFNKNEQIEFYGEIEHNEIWRKPIPIV